MFNYILVIAKGIRFVFINEIRERVFPVLNDDLLKRRLVFCLDEMKIDNGFPRDINAIRVLAIDQVFVNENIDAIIAAIISAANLSSCGLVVV